MNRRKVKHLARYSLPLAKLMIDTGTPLSEAVEMLKAALVETVLERDPGASASHVSLVTGVHRKDIKRLENATAAPVKSTSAARVLTLWQNDPNFLENDTPRDLPRSGDDGFDALVRRSKVDAAPATVLSLLIDAGSVEMADDLIRVQKSLGRARGQDRENCKPPSQH